MPGRRARIGLRPSPAATAREPLPRDARVFLGGVVAIATAALVVAFAAPAPSRADWLTFVALASGAAVAQQLIVPVGRHRGFPLAVVFLVAAALLLPPQLVAATALVQHLPDVFGRRFAAPITLFNTANYMLDALAAWAAATVVWDAAPDTDAGWAAGAFAAAAALVALNHLALGLMLRLARGTTASAPAVLDPTALLADLSLAGLGAVFAFLWLTNPYLLVLALAPLALVHRSFALLARLGESEGRFRALFENAPIGTALVDLDGRIVSTNATLRQLLGYDQDELAGTAFAALELDAAADVLGEVLSGARERAGDDCRLRRKDGTTAAGRFEVALARDAQRRPQFAIAMFEDMTQRRQLEEQLRQSQKLEAIGKLAGGVAHDFNNLLTIILGRTRRTLQSAVDDPTLTADLEEVSDAAERAADLTRQLLAFGRRQMLQPRVLDLNDAVARPTHLLGRLIGEDVELVVELAPDAGRVEVDPIQLEQVIMNLAVNARDAMPDGGRLTIVTSAVDLGVRGRFAAMSVQDTGEGMDEATRSHIFEPFFTTKPPGEGTGLGLATVHGIVGQSGGFVRVESAPGEGSTFTVYLPRATGEPHAEELPARAEAETSAASETVLLVEDDDGVRELARLFLTGAGYTTLVARDGREALALAESHDGPLDLLVTDLVMPGIGGVELAEGIASLRPGIRVLYMSGYAGDGRPDEAGGGPLFVPKPFTEETLLRTVRQAVAAPRT